MLQEIKEFYLLKKPINNYPVWGLQEYKTEEETWPKTITLTQTDILIKSKKYHGYNKVNYCGVVNIHIPNEDLIKINRNVLLSDKEIRGGWKFNVEILQKLKEINYGKVEFNRI